MIKEREWTILNGSFEKEEKWTYVGETGALVIDYIVVNEEAREEVKKVTEGYRTYYSYTMTVYDYISVFNLFIACNMYCLRIFGADDFVISTYVLLTIR